MKTRRRLCGCNNYRLVNRQLHQTIFFDTQPYLLYLLIMLQSGSPL